MGTLIVIHFFLKTVAIISSPSLTQFAQSTAQAESWSFGKNAEQEAPDSQPSFQFGNLPGQTGGPLGTLFSDNPLGLHQPENTSSKASSPSKSPSTRSKVNNDVQLDFGDMSLYGRQQRRNSGSPLLKSLTQQQENAGDKPSSPPFDTDDQYQQWTAAPSRGGRKSHRGNMFGKKNNTTNNNTSPSGGDGGGLQQEQHGAATASDGVPNLGEVTWGLNADNIQRHHQQFQKWQIPAVHNTDATAGIPVFSSVNIERDGTGMGGFPTKSGAAVKMGKRKAWLRYLAYEGAWQVCLEALIEAGNGNGDANASTAASTFLQDRCAVLKRALSLQGLMLTPCTVDDDNAIYWDDKDDELLEAEAFELLQEAALEAARAAAATQQEPIVEQPPVIAGPVDSGAPCIEARVVRVVGCGPLLQATGDQTFHAVLYHGSHSTSSGGAITLVSTDGTTHQHESIKLAGNAQQNGALTVELQADGTVIAAGTVQTTELSKLAAAAREVEGGDGTMPSGSGKGWFRSLFSGGTSKWKSANSANNLTWVGLVDRAGKMCGHVVVSARDASVGLGPPPSQQGGFLGAAAAQQGGFLGPPPSQQGQQQQQISGNSNGGNGLHIEEVAGNNSLYSMADAPNGRKGGDTTATDHSASPLHAMLALNEGRMASGRKLMRNRMCNAATIGGTGAAANSTDMLHVTSPAVYDELLGAALSAQGCGPRNLSLAGAWGWLLQKFSMQYGVRPNHTALSYLSWLLHPDNATVTEDCLDAALQQLACLKGAQAEGKLSNGELAALTQVCAQAEELILACFENYFMLSEDAPRGVVDTGPAARSAAPPALRPAVGLFVLLRDAKSSLEDQDWLCERFRVAARRRYHGLLTAAELGQPAGDRRVHEAGEQQRGRGGGGGGSAGRAYARLQHLCRAVMDELRADEAIQDTGVLPDSVCLPALTAMEYVKGVAGHTGRVLEKYPPPAPTESAIQLVEAVGRLQDFCVRHGYGDAAAHLNSKDIFGSHVEDWLAASASALRQAVSTLEKSHPSAGAMQSWHDFPAAGGGGGNGSGGRRKVAPIVQEMLRAVEYEMKRYERIIAYWPVHGPDLEAAVTGALREATAVVSRQCGLVQQKVNSSSGGGNEGSPMPMLPPLSVSDRSQGLMGGGTLMSPLMGGGVVAAAAAGRGTPLFSSSGGGGRLAWRWIRPQGDMHHQAHVVGGGNNNNSVSGAAACLQQGITPSQALLLNSLRCLLAAAPQLEHALANWCAGRVVGATRSQVAQNKSASPTKLKQQHQKQSTNTTPQRQEIMTRAAAAASPDLGAQFAQLVKELRSEYFAAITLCAEKLAGEIARLPHTSIIMVLRREGSHLQPMQTVEQLSRALSKIQRLLELLSAALDGRVFVALTRGLWDLTARDILEYAEDLREGGEQQKAAWRGRQNASAALGTTDKFFKAMLASAMGTDLQDKDLGLPQHSGRAHKLLDVQQAALAMSYDVY